MEPDRSQSGEKDIFSDQVIAGMYRHFDKLLGMSRLDWDEIRPYLKVTQVPAKTSLQLIGSQVRYHHYIDRGLVRLYYITPDGKDINKGFYSEGYIAGSLSGLILTEASRFGIETLEPCTLVEMDLVDFDELMGRCEGWARMFNHACQMMLVRNERREAELLTMSSQARFLQFTKNFKNNIDRIPQYHVASYLGITPSALSRFKKKWLADQP